MATAGPRYPGTTASEQGPSGDNDWISTSPISADDGSEAQITAATFDANDNSYRLKATNFGFDTDIPAGSTILGITVEIDRRCFAGAAEDQEVRLYDSTATLVGDDKQTATAWPATLQIATYGGSADTWNAGLDAADVRSANFGVALIVLATGANTDIGVDFIRVTIEYAPPTQTIEPTLLDSGRALYEPTITRPAQSVGDLALLDSGRAIYQPTVASINGLTLGLLDAGPTLYAPTVVAEQAVDLGLLDSGPALYAPTVTAINGLTLGLLDSARAIYGPLIQSDTFTEASTTLLRNHTADTGASWAHFWDMYGADGAQLTIDPASDRVHADAAGFGDESADVLGDAISGAVDAYVTVAVAATDLAGPVVRGLADKHFYFAYYDGAYLRVCRWGEVGSPTTIALALLSLTAPFRIRLHAEGASPTTLRARAWNVGDAEPETWAVDTTDGTAAWQNIAGKAGVLVANWGTSDEVDDFVLVSGGMGVFAEQAIDLTLLDSGPSLYAPALVQMGGTQDITLSLLDSGPAVYPPVVMPDQSLDLGLLDSTRGLYEPGLASSTTIFATLLDSGPAVFAPTVTPELLADLSLLDSGPTVYPPTVSQLGGPQTVTAPLLDSGSSLYPPTLLALASEIIPLLDAERSLYPPTLELGATPVSLSLLDSARAQYAPIIGLAGRPRGATAARTRTGAGRARGATAGREHV